MKKFINSLTYNGKHFFISVLVTIILLLCNVVFMFTNYARILKFPKELDRFKFLGIYIPNLTMYKLFKTTPNAYYYTKLYFYIITIVIIILFLIYIVSNFEYIKTKIKGEMKYGRARWGKRGDLSYQGFFKPTIYSKVFDVDLTSNKGVFLGEFNKLKVRDSSNTHLMVVAPTRSGKGVSIIIPTLVDTWSDSVIVFDMKGENFDKTAGYRQQKFKNKIIKFAPTHIDSNKYNPLDAIRYLTSKEGKDIRNICEMIVKGEGKKGSSDPFWDNSAVNVLSTLILYIKYKFKGNGCMGDVLEFINDSSAPLIERLRMYLKKDENEIEEEFLELYRSLQLNLDEETIKELKEIYRSPKDLELLNQGRHPEIERGIVMMTSNDDKTFENIMSTVNSKLGLFTEPLVKFNTSKSDFKVEDLVNGDYPVSVYMIIEAEDQDFLAPLLRIFLTQVVSILSQKQDFKKAKNKTNNYKYKCLLLLDEFSSMGNIPILEKGSAFIAGYGLKLMLILQSLDQLYNIYGDKNGFMGNCQIKVFYANGEPTTNKYISESIGTTTINTKSTSGHFLKTNNTLSQTGQPLIRPEDIRSFDKDKMILLVDGKPAFKLKKVLYFNSEFKNRVDYDIDLKNTFSKKGEKNEK